MPGLNVLNIILDHILMKQDYVILSINLTDGNKIYFYDINELHNQLTSLCLFWIHEMANTYQSFTSGLYKKWSN